MKILDIMLMNVGLEKKISLETMKKKQAWYMKTQLTTLDH